MSSLPTLIVLEPLIQFVTNSKNPALILNNHGMVLECNFDFAKLYSVTRAQVLERQYDELAAKLLKNLPFNSFSELYNNNSTINQINSSLYQVQTIEWIVNVIHLQDKTPVIILTGKDISKFVNATAKAGKIQKSIIDFIPNNYFIFWKDKNLVYQGCNQAFVQAFGFKSIDDIVGKTDYDLSTTKAQSNAYRADDQEVISTGKPKLNIEEYQTLQDGGQRILLTSKVPLFNNYGEVEGVLAIYSDITDRKKMEKELHQAKKTAQAANLAKTEFIANMSHDLRTPLTGIIGMAQLLTEMLNNAEHTQYAIWLKESGEQLLQLANNVLEIVSADIISADTLQEETFDLAESIHNLAKLELPALTLKNLTIKIEIDDSVPKCVIGDKFKLNRILLNLLGNSIKFTDKGYIGIKVKQLAQAKQQIILQFDVYDSGIGIPEHLQEKIFECFFRATPSYLGNYRGYGVGLNIVKKYVEVLGGKISLTSQVGEGTTFSIILPFQIGDIKDLVIIEKIIENDILTNNTEQIQKDLNFNVVNISKKYLH